MNNTFIDITFLLFTLFLLCKIFAYGIYEIKNEKNIFGGVTTIAFSIIAVIFSNVMVWIN